MYFWLEICIYTDRRDTPVQGNRESAFIQGIGTDRSLSVCFTDRQRFFAMSSIEFSSRMTRASLARTLNLQGCIHRDALGQGGNPSRDAPIPGWWPLYLLINGHHPKFSSLAGRRQIIKTDLDLARKLRDWKAFYNFLRPHAALNGETPYERLREKLVA